MQVMQLINGTNKSKERERTEQIISERVQRFVQHPTSKNFQNKFPSQNFSMKTSIQQSSVLAQIQPNL